MIARMMMRRIAMAVAALIGAAAPVLAGAQGDPKASCDGGTYEMVDCLGAQAAYWDKKMTEAYRDLLKNPGNKQQRDQLRAAQRLWIQYRDANCLYYAVGEGSIARIEAAECMRSMTEARARELIGINTPNADIPSPDRSGKENRN